jgi:hypothetical protein
MEGTYLGPAALTAGAKRTPCGKMDGAAAHRRHSEARMSTLGAVARPLDGGAPILGRTRAPARGPMVAPPHRGPSPSLPTAMAGSAVLCGAERKEGRERMEKGE